MKKLLFSLVIIASLIPACGGGKATHTPEPTEASEATDTPEPEPTKVLEEEEVIVTTDKTEYEPGEVIEISVRNNLDVPIGYAQEAECGTGFWLLESCDNHRVFYSGYMCDWEIPQHGFTKLDPGETLKGTEFKDIKREWIEFKLAEPGCYRIVFPYSLEEKQSMGDGWGKDRVEVYSNEFTVK
jgi:hypothetical protein